MSSNTIFFDVGGTLEDAPDFFEHITRQLTQTWPNKKTYYLLIKTFFSMYPKNEDPHSFLSVERMLAKTLTLLAKEHGYPDISSQALDLYMAVYFYRSSLFPETLTVLEKLHRSGVKMVIASDADSGIMEPKLVRYDLNKYFVDKVLSESVRAYKPTDGFIKHLKKHITVEKDNCYFVGDSSVDIESGKKLGIKSVHINRKNSSNEFGADYVIKDLTELLQILKIK